MKLKSYAKINLSLKVLGKRADGYHEIESVMQSISLHDVIVLKEADKGINLVCQGERIPQGKGNIAYRAAEGFLQRVKFQGSRGVEINIEKNVPVAAGLAGGSGNAAAVLIGLNKLWGTNLSDKELLSLGGKIGADVPFCLLGGRAICRGIGEKVEKLSPLKEGYFVIVKPDIQVSTKWAYDQISKIQDTITKQIPNSLTNDLEAVVVSKYPEIKEIKEKLLVLGAEVALMTGSGPTVFGLVKGKEKAEEIAQQFKKDHDATFVATPVDNGVEIVENN